MQHPQPVVSLAEHVTAPRIGVHQQVFAQRRQFAAYRKLTTLREYLLVDTDSRRCDVFRKRDDGLWVLHPFEAGQAVGLASGGLELSAEALWAEVPGAPP